MRELHASNATSLVDLAERVLELARARVDVVLVTHPAYLPDDEAATALVEALKLLLRRDRLVVIVSASGPPAALGPVADVPGFVGSYLDRDAALQALRAAGPEHERSSWYGKRIVRKLRQHFLGEK